jgi:hypothetical protein
MIEAAIVLLLLVVFGVPAMAVLGLFVQLLKLIADTLVWVVNLLLFWVK